SPVSSEPMARRSCRGGSWHRPANELERGHGFEVGPDRAHEADRAEPALRDRAWHPHDSVDLRCFPVRPRMAGPIDEHIAHRPDQMAASTSCDRLLQLRALPEALECERARDLLAETRGQRPVLAREREEPRPVEVRLLNEPQQLVVVLLGLAGISEYERRAEH